RRHARALRRELTVVEQEAHQARDATDISVHGAEPGIYIQFESPANVELKLESLEDRRKGIELVAVQNTPGVERSIIQLATVFVPDGSLKHFFDRFEQYERQRTKKNEPRHKDLIDRIAALRRATLRALWTDSTEAYPREMRPFGGRFGFGGMMAGSLSAFWSLQRNLISLSANDD